MTCRVCVKDHIGTSPRAWHWSLLALLISYASQMAVEESASQLPSTVTGIRSGSTGLTEQLQQDVEQGGKQLQSGLSGIVKS